jgi:hypothetical protein
MSSGKRSAMIAPCQRGRRRITGIPSPNRAFIRPIVLWSVRNIGIVFVTREPDFDAIDLYRFSNRRVARVDFVRESSRLLSTSHGIL